MDFNPRGKPSKGVRPYCRLRVYTAEAAIDAAIAGVGVTKRALLPGRAGGGRGGSSGSSCRTMSPTRSRCTRDRPSCPSSFRRFTEFAASRLRRSLAADLAKLTAPKTSAEKKK